MAFRWPWPARGGRRPAPAASVPPAADPAVPPALIGRGDALLALVGLAFVGILCRLHFVQVVQHPVYRARQTMQTAGREPLPAHRGELRDRHGASLALSKPVESIFLEPPRAGDLDRTVSRLAAALSLDPERLRAAAARPGCKFAWVKRRAGEAEAAVVKALKLPGVGIRREYVRVFPSGRTAGTLLGRTGIDDEGLEGLERTLDAILRGVPGETRVVNDALRRTRIPDPAARRDAVPGRDVWLTLDLGIQQILEDELDRAAEAWHPVSATAIVVDPQTGEVLAMACRPDFNPNDAASGPMSSHRNRCLTDPYEPGSTFKPFITCGVLDEGLARPGSLFNCENGAWQTRGRLLHDHHPYGVLSLTDVIVKSSNIGAAKLGLLLESKRTGNQRDWVAKFGFGQPTGVGLPGESSGRMTPASKWSSFTSTSVPMGHEILATSAQLARGFSAIANGGTLRPLRIVRGYGDAGGAPEQVLPAAPGIRVMKPATAQTMTDILTQVVERGTGTKAALDTVRVAGKTGTSQKIDAAGHYTHDKFIATFVGYAPAERPALLVLVSLDEPQGEYYGGVVAAPAAQAILRRALQYLGIP